MLHEFITANRDEIVASARARVAERAAPRPTEEELISGIPLFLDQLADTLRFSRPTSDAMNRGATARGNALLRRGFTVSQVVHDYGDICQAITRLAIVKGAPITTDEFQTLNRCLDDAIARAVTEYARERDLSLSRDETEQHGTFAHELRNLLNVAMMSYEILKQGSVGITGSTGAMLGRSLLGLRDLIDRSLASVRLESALRKRQRVSLAEIFEELEADALLEATTRGLALSVASVPKEIEIEVDRALLASALANLLQNALKFSHAQGRISVTARRGRDRVFIDIEDECGGLPDGKIEELFRPFEQRSRDRNGLGLGLTISRRAVQDSGGEIHVQNLPGKGCVFTVDLPLPPPHA
jgi:signal transduction histidine kinase